MNTAKACRAAVRGLLLLFLFPAASFGAFDHTGILADPLTALDTSRVFRTEFAVSEKLLESPTLTEDDLKRVLEDRDSRISPEFRIPDGIEPRVRFWLSIYTEHTTQHSVLFDAREPEIVYDVLDFRPLFKSSRNLAAYEIVSRQRIRKAQAKIRAALLALARNRKLKNLTPDQARILAAVRKSGTNTPFSLLAHRIRSQTGQRDNVMRGLVAAEPFLSKMEMIFREMEIPLELTRITLVESSFNLRAYSRVGAAGVWQFMPKSAREYMRIDNGLDERLSPLKATVAAGRLLKRNHKMLGNWTLAVIAYNHGHGGLPRLRGKNADDFSRIAHLFSACRTSCGGKKRSPLGFASKNYYAEFLAMTHAEAYRELFFGEPPQLGQATIAFQRLEKPTNGLSIASQRGVAMRDFMVFNPDVRDLRRTLPRGYWLAFPANEDNVTILASSRGRSKPRAPVPSRDVSQTELIRAYDVHNPRLRNNQF
ncbi:MAG TPA: lytic transglycosylase domain-containing protein [Bdellovibrionota bacterium]|nr:lytic transglycosylase domain-containing protein [Bdellovibrionota bacterium]